MLQVNKQLCQQLLLFESEGAHSPDERASISSAQKFWKFVIEILEHIPVKQ
jgi:di/tripeptidase